MGLIKLSVISDSHNLHEQIKIPDCDILIHCGDATYHGYEWELKEFFEWFVKQPAKHKIFIPGNHDESFERNPDMAFNCIPEGGNVIVLIDQAIEIEGIKIYGTPWSTLFGGWAFMKQESDLKEIWAKIPDDTDILVVHGPPRGVLDFCVPSWFSPSGHCAGSSSLGDRIKQIQPKFVFCGHIHESAGVDKIGKTTVVNASCVDVRCRFARGPYVSWYDDLPDDVQLPKLPEGDGSKDLS